MKVYIAGPMTGIPAFNIPAFDAAAETLRARGFEVVSPAEVDGPVSRAVLLKSESGDHKDLPETESWSFYLARDFRILADEGIQLIVTLPGWENSKGARLEVVVGKELGIDRMDLENLIGLQDFAYPAGDFDSAPEAASAVATEQYDEAGRFVPYEENPLRQRAVTGGVKDNRGKLPLDLIPYEPLLGATTVLAFGAAKYKPGNWRLGLSWSQTWSSLQRHLWAWMNGEDVDPESGLLHIDHAMCQLLFLSTYVHTGTGIPDRWVDSDPEDSVA